MFNLFRRKPRIFRLGLGEVLLTHGTLDGDPVVGIAPAHVIGEPGKPVPNEDAAKEYVKKHGIFLQFTSTRSATRFADHMYCALRLAAEELTDD